MKKQMIHYWLAMNANAIQAAAAAGYSWLGAAAAHAADNAIPAMQTKTLLWVLAVAFISSVLLWLSKNPLPVDVVPDKRELSPDEVEQVAEEMYTYYSVSVGGKGFNGDPLPGWKEFSTNANTTKQADAWRALAFVFVESKPPTPPVPAQPK